MTFTLTMTLTNYDTTGQGDLAPPNDERARFASLLKEIALNIDTRRADTRFSGGGLIVYMGKEIGEWSCR